MHKILLTVYVHSPKLQVYYTNMQFLRIGGGCKVANYACDEPVIILRNVFILRYLVVASISICLSGDALYMCRLRAARPHASGLTLA